MSNLVILDISDILEGLGGQDGQQFRSCEKDSKNVYK
jgi:hypothetical protein